MRPVAHRAGSTCPPSPVRIPDRVFEPGPSSLARSSTVLVNGTPAFQIFSFDGAAYSASATRSAATLLPGLSNHRDLDNLRDLALALLFATVVTTLGGAGARSLGGTTSASPLHEATLAGTRSASREASTPASPEPMARATLLHRAQSIRWSTPSRTASNARGHALPPTSRTSCDRLSRHSRIRPRCWSRDADELPERSQQALDLLTGEIHRFQRMVFDLLESPV